MTEQFKQPQQVEMVKYAGLTLRRDHGGNLVYEEYPAAYNSVPTQAEEILTSETSSQPNTIEVGRQNNIDCPDVVRSNLEAIRQPEQDSQSRLRKIARRTMWVAAVGSAIFVPAYAVSAIGTPIVTGGNERVSLADFYKDAINLSHNVIGLGDE